MAKRDTVLAALGQNVRARRHDAGISQEALAFKAELDRTYVSGIERGIRNPSIKNLVRLAKALGISTAKLCEGVDA